VEIHFDSRFDTHSNLLSKLNLRLADQFNNMNHMERFALGRGAFARKNFITIFTDSLLEAFRLSSSGKMAVVYLSKFFVLVNF